MPQGSTVINEGCKLLIVGSQSDIHKAKKIINSPHTPKDLIDV